MIVSCVINVVGSILLGIYIFKGKKSKMITLKNVSKNHAMEKKTMDDIFLFKEFISFFTRLVRSGISQYNHYLLILHGHGSSHVTF